MIENSYETFYTSVEQESGPFMSLPRRDRRSISRDVYDRTIYYADLGLEEEEIIALVQCDIEKKYGSIILLAVLAAVVQFLVLKLLRWIWPDRVRSILT